MIRPKASSQDGSVALGGDNNGAIINVKAAEGANVGILIQSEIARKLPSHLGAVIGFFANQGLANLEDTKQRELPPEVIVKLNFNNLPRDHWIVGDWQRHINILERSYHGAEQQNANARYLVRRKAGITYEDELLKACIAASVPEDQRVQYAQRNAASLVQAVTGRLMMDYQCSRNAFVEEEMAHLAVSLVVADAVVECEVLEKPDHATPA